MVVVVVDADAITKEKIGAIQRHCEEYESADSNRKTVRSDLEFAKLLVLLVTESIKLKINHKIL